MCGFITDIVDSIVDIVTDVVDIVVDVVEDVVGWLTPEVDIPDFSQIQADQNARGVLVNKFSANSFIPVVYGTRKVGGNVVFLETSGTDNQYLYMALVLSECEINDITSIFVNDNQVTFNKFEEAKINLWYKKNKTPYLLEHIEPGVNTL